MMEQQSEKSASTEKPESGNFWRGKKKLVLLIGIPLVIGLVAAAALLVNYRKNQPIELNPDVAAVDIADSGFSPQTVKIKAGQVVSWTNMDIAPHRLMADPDKLPDFETPESLNQGDTYTYIFDKSGTFNYYDPSNPASVGSIIVE